MCSIRDVNIFSVEMAADSHLLTQTEAGLGKWRVLVYYVVTCTLHCYWKLKLNA